MAAEDTRVQDYFIRSCNVWFPDFEERMKDKEQRYQKRSFHAMLDLLCYFRSKLTRQQFISRFVSQEAPEKILPSEKALYSQARSLCSAFQTRKISDAEFDEQLLLAFRERPTEDVFAPPFESWDEIKRLIYKFEHKRKLPVWLDLLGWLGFLKGNVSRQPYAEIVCGEGSHLCQLLEFGTDAVKEDLNGKYSMEVSVALRLRKLGIDYKFNSLSNEDFDAQFLLLAKEFCSDIPD